MKNLIYPARKHAAKVFEKLIQFNPTYTKSNLPIIYLEGSKIKYRDGTDREFEFHQESNFMYLTGAYNIKDASVLISIGDIGNPDGTTRQNVAEKDVSTVLFIPKVDPLEVMWCGLPETPIQIKKRLPGLSDVKYKTEFKDYLNAIKLKLKSSNENLDDEKDVQVLTLPSITHADSTPDAKLLEAIHEARTTKTEEEIQLIATANQISSIAHTSIMKLIHEEVIDSESLAENYFRSECHRHGFKTQAYEPIFAYGTHAGTLHYMSNNFKFPPDSTGVLLIDAGCESYGYASDITRTLPIGNGGRFTKEAKDIYSIVLEMQETAVKHIKPGIEWEEIHILMHKVAAAGLLKIGILRDLTVDECYAKELVIPFFPHGVGHFLGLDTHDVGGFPNGKSKNPAVKYLRLQRKLEVGNVVTVEPGLYFNQFLLDPIKGSKFLNQETLLKYLAVGGIRIEDNVVVTTNGCKNLTNVVKTIEDIEKITCH